MIGLLFPWVGHNPQIIYLLNSAGVDMAGRQAEFDERVKRMVELNDAAAGESGDDDNDDSVSP